MASNNLCNRGRGLVCCLGLIASASYADFTDGIRAYEAGDYGTAMAAWLPLAEEGDPSAMYNVALMYDHGLGVAVDKARAIRWYQ